MIASIRNIKQEISIMAADDELCGRGHKPDPKIRELEIEQEEDFYFDAYYEKTSRQKREMI